MCVHTKCIHQTMQSYVVHFVMRSYNIKINNNKEIRGVAMLVLKSAVSGQVIDDTNYCFRQIVRQPTVEQ